MILGLGLLLLFAIKSRSSACDFAKNNLYNTNVVISLRCLCVQRVFAVCFYSDKILKSVAACQLAAAEPSPSHFCSLGDRGPQDLPP